MGIANTVKIGGKELSLPGSWRVIDEPRPNPAPGLADLRGALLGALERPTGCAPLPAAGLAGKKIVIAADDITRPTPLARFLPDVIEYLAARGARKEEMRIVTALGIHRPMTPEEAARKLGGTSLEGVAWENHDCRDEAKLARLGTTARGTEVVLNRRLVEADLVLCVGAIEPHPLLGFGGGLKMILPGLAHERTIAQNHMQGVSPEKFNYVGAAESPMRLDLEEAAAMIGRPVFIVNAVMNEKLEIARFVCGDPVAAHREGARLAASINARRVGEKADVAIVASDPMNADLRQGMKCIANVEGSVKEGGLIVALLACENGIGDVAVPPRSLPHGLLRALLGALGRRRVLWFVDRVKKGAGVEERFLAHFSLQVARKNEIFVHSPNLPPGTGKRIGLFRQFDDAGAMMQAAARRAPRAASVYVWPYGGVTYPVFASK